jgi:hypothetical protein
LHDIKKIEDKYNGCSAFFDLVDENYSEALCILRKSGVRHHLLYMLKDAYLGGMLRHKSKELLAKLELLS